MPFDNVDLEIDQEGPKLKFGLWRRTPRKRSLAERIDRMIASLDIRRRAADMAAAGLPAVDSDQPTSLELRIRAGLQGLLDEEAAAATAAIEARRTELATLGTDVLDSDYGRILAALEGELRTVETDLATSLPKPMRRFVQAETDLARFNESNITSSEPAGRSVGWWLLSAAATMLVEAVLNTLLFKAELGVGPGARYALTVGAALAFAGTGVGIGIGHMQRRGSVRKAMGAAAVAAAAALGGFLLTRIGLYRAELADPNAQVGAIAALLKPAMLPYAVLNLAGIVAVAWKAIPVFAFRDLKVLRDAYDSAADVVAAIVTAAQDRCETLRVDKGRDVERVAAVSEANAARGHKLADCGSIVTGLETAAGRLSDAVVAAELEFRETIGRVHPQGPAHVRFRIAPERLAQPVVVVDPHLASTATGLEARKVAMRDAVTDAGLAVDAAANAAKSSIAGQVQEIEEVARATRAGGANVFRFRRAGAAA